MPKVKISNTREHDITLSAVAPNGEVMQATIPAAREDREDKTAPLIAGVATVDTELLELCKDKVAVQTYFKEGWLVLDERDARRIVTGVKVAMGGTETAPAAKTEGGTDEVPDALGNANAPWNKG